MRLVEPLKSKLSDQHFTLSSTPCPHIEAAYNLSADDDKAPSRNIVYFLGDITPILHSSSAYDEDVRAHRHGVTSIAWIVCAFVNGRDSKTIHDPITIPHVLLQPPAKGSLVVINGSTPRAGNEQDYHDWYDQEHGDKLTLVPGWNSGRRYRLAKLYGEAEVASFYGFNYYNEENGLGGPEWKAGVTEWTLRIRSNAAKPNIRRVWKVAETSSTSCSAAE